MKPSWYLINFIMLKFSYFDKMQVPSQYMVHLDLNQLQITHALQFKLMFDVFAFSVSSIYNRQERKSSLALNYMHYLAKTYTPFPSYLKHLPKLLWTSLRQQNWVSTLRSIVWILDDPASFVSWTRKRKKTSLYRLFSQDGPHNRKFKWSTC